MNRLSPFRIVGFAFLAFAALTVYQGEFQLGRSSGPIVSRVQNPDTFWRYVIIQIGIGLTLLYLGRSTLPEASLSGGDRAAETPEDLPRLPNYDPLFCGRFVKAAAYAGAGLIIAELLVLLLVNPSDKLCPEWIIRPHQRSATSLWLLAGMFTVLPAIWICYVALHWDRYYARKVYDSIAYGPPAQLFMPMNLLVPAIMTGWTVFSAMPLFLMLGTCTSLAGYLNLDALSLLLQRH